MKEGEEYGPTARWFNPFRVNTFWDSEGWGATYKLRNGSSTVSGCESKKEAIEELRHMVTMRVVYVNGKFEEVK